MWDFSNIFYFEPLSNREEYFYCYLHSYNERSRMHYACFSDKYCIVKYVYEFNTNEESGRLVSNQIKEGKRYIKKDVLLKTKNFHFANDITEDYESIFTIKDGEIKYHFEILNETSSEYFKRGEWYDKYIQVLPYDEYMKKHRPNEEKENLIHGVHVVYFETPTDKTICPLFRMFYRYVYRYDEQCYILYDFEFEVWRKFDKLTNFEFYDMLDSCVKRRINYNDGVFSNVFLRTWTHSEQIKAIISNYNQEVWMVDSFIYNGTFSLILINKQDNTFEKYVLEGNDFVKVEETLYNKQLSE